MKIQNKSSYDTEDLRAFFSEVFRHEGVKHSGYKITVRNTRYPRQDCCTGCAYLNSKVMTIRLPTQARVMGSDGYSCCKDAEIMPNPEKVAQVVAHEIHHTLGYTHGEMLRSSKLSTPSKLPIVRLKQEKPKGKEDLVEKRYHHALKKLKEWQKKEKKALTIRRKWHKKVAYYENKLRRDQNE